MAFSLSSRANFIIISIIYIYSGRSAWDINTRTVANSSSNTRNLAVCKAGDIGKQPLLGIARSGTAKKGAKNVLEK